MVTQPEQFPTLAAYIRMGWECANPDVVRNGLSELRGTSYEVQANEATTLFDAFLSTDRTRSKLFAARQARARKALERIEALLEAA